jgi:hypothetical protein
MPAHLPSRTSASRQFCQMTEAVAAAAACEQIITDLGVASTKFHHPACGSRSRQLAQGGHSPGSRSLRLNITGVFARSCAG